MAIRNRAVVVRDTAVVARQRPSHRGRALLAAVLFPQRLSGESRAGDLPSAVNGSGAASDEIGQGSVPGLESSSLSRSLAGEGVSTTTARRVGAGSDMLNSSPSSGIASVG